MLVLLSAAPGLADDEAAERFRQLSYGGGMLNAVHPREARVLRFQDLGRRAARANIRADSVYLALEPGLGVRRADDALLDRHLQRRFETDD